MEQKKGLQLLLQALDSIGPRPYKAGDGETLYEIV